jgi:starch synthase
MKILFVAAEAAPLAQVGGLAEVIGSLPQALIRLGQDVRLIMPRYGCIDISRYDSTMVADGIEVNFSGQKQRSAVKLIKIAGNLPVYLVENDEYFGGRDIYTDNDVERFLYFSQVVFKALHVLNWKPDIVHCHDWHAAMVIRLLKYESVPCATVFTIHNLAYQGGFDPSFYSAHNLRQYWDCSSCAGAQLSPMNLMSQGILWADMVTTVSETYAHEITTPAYGEGLDQLVATRLEKLVGIVNGIDYSEFDPETDPHIIGNYDFSSPGGKTVNKLTLQKRYGLQEGIGIPLIGIVQRMDEQKGIDILINAFDHIMQNTSAQFAILGRGRGYYEDKLRQVAHTYPGRIAVSTDFDNGLAHLIYAGSDMFLMPSRFEPCGLGQLIAMRYGTLPIVRHTGGLVDTVSEFNDDLSSGSGFVFFDYTAEALTNAVIKATDSFGNKVAWINAEKRVMLLDLSWGMSARKYEAVYKQVTGINPGGS